MVSLYTRHPIDSSDKLEHILYQLKILKTIKESYESELKEEVQRLATEKYGLIVGKKYRINYLGSILSGIFVNYHTYHTDRIIGFNFNAINKKGKVSEGLTLICELDDIIGEIDEEQCRWLPKSI